MMHIHSPNLSSRAGAFETFPDCPHEPRTTTPRPFGRLSTSAPGIEMVPLPTAAGHDGQPIKSVSDRVRSSQPMNREAMIQVLKARNLSVHGAYIYHLGIPAILLLASAYATDRITRNVFFDTLDLFVQHTSRSSDHPKGIKAHHLTRLGISAEDANKLPLIDSDCDLYTVAGLFNGLIELEDLELLYSPDKKGQFLQRYFPGMKAAPVLTLSSPQILWRDDDLLIRDSTGARFRRIQDQIPSACTQLELGPDCYSGIRHYMLRLIAATRNGRVISELGPVGSNEEMEQLFHNIFHVVEPNYQPSVTWRQDLEHFRFVEPSQRENKHQQTDSRTAGPAHANQQRKGSRLPCNLV